MKPSAKGLQILQENAPSRMCQCARPDPVLEYNEAFCALCGGNPRGEQLALALFDPLVDVADARLCNRFDCSL